MSSIRACSRAYINFFQIVYVYLALYQIDNNLFVMEIIMECCVREVKEDNTCIEYREHKARYGMIMATYLIKNPSMPSLRFKIIYLKNNSVTLVCKKNVKYLDTFLYV